jgi:hypothetical protein
MNMHMINPPKAGRHPFDRHLDCEEALERDFHELAEAAEKAGWTRSDIASAIVSLAHHYRHAEDDFAAYDEPADGTFCSSLKPVDTANLHPILHREIKDRSDFLDFEAYRASVRFYPSGLPAGWIELAINPMSGEVSAIHANRVIVGPELTKVEIQTTDPQWGKADGARHAAMLFYDALRRSGHLKHEFPEGDPDE